jgi:hypothetical protein
MRNAIVVVFAAVAAVAAFAREAFAQDYVVTSTSGQFETVPANAVDLMIHPDGLTYAGSLVDLPFPFSYYGGAYERIWVARYGFLQFGTIAGSTTETNSILPPNAPEDGIAAPCWGHVFGDAWGWTAGTAPNRRYIVAWKDVALGSPSNTAKVSFEAILYEGTGRIVFAYTAGTGVNPWFPFGGFTYAMGLDSPGDSRWVVPTTNNTSHTGQPANDYQFDPRSVTVTGRVLYDRVVSDATGIGNSVESGVAPESLRVELRSSARTVAVGKCDATGGFSLVAYASPTTTTASITLLADAPGCIVRQVVGGYASSATFVPSVTLSSDQAVGTWTIGAGADPPGTTRATFDVARTIGRAYSWATARTSATIPKLDVQYVPSDAAKSAYTRANAPLPALLQIGSAASGNDDGWDRDVELYLYARHLLASIAALPAPAPDPRFDAVTTPQNAFEEAFCYWLVASQLGVSEYVDGLDGSHATRIDLETPTLFSPLGPDVAGWIAGLLNDLADPANETLDRVDGTGAASANVFLAVDSLAAAPTASTFYSAWIAAGFDAPGITRLYVADGLIADDAFEPNDDPGESTPIGSIGTRRSGLLLNRFNEDWFSVTLPAGAPSLVADATYDRGSLTSAIVLEIRDSAGSLLATGAPVGSFGPVRATTASVAAGTYKIGVRHVSGEAIPTYTVQSYLALDMAAAPLVDWTVGRDYDVALGVVGGIPPIAATTPASAMPPGLGLLQPTLHAVGRPTTPGTYQVAVQVRDDGNPANVLQRMQTVTIHDVFKMPIAPFVCFPAGRTVDATLPTHGGTPPFTLTMSSGALTPGLAFAPNSLHVVGTATPGPSSAFELDGVDVAGSADHVPTRAVVAVQITGKKIPADLASGVDACGWWFDAVEGSTVTFSVATAKGAAKRALTGAFLAPDRSLVATGKIVGKLGAVAASKLVCPQSGRYYFVGSTTDVGLATQLLGTATVTLPKAGKGLNKTFAPKATTTIEFGAVPGSTATVHFAGDKKATLVAKIVAVLDPAGTPVAFVEYVRATALGGTLTMPLATGGTWTVVLGATSTSGVPGKLTYSYSLKQLRGSVYSAD